MYFDICFHEGEDVTYLSDYNGFLSTIFCITMFVHVRDPRLEKLVNNGLRLIRLSNAHYVIANYMCLVGLRNPGKTKHGGIRSDTSLK